MVNQYTTLNLKHRRYMPYSKRAMVKGVRASIPSDIVGVRCDISGDSLWAKGIQGYTDLQNHSHGIRRARVSHTRDSIVENHGYGKMKTHFKDGTTLEEYFASGDSQWIQKNGEEKIML